MKYLLLPLALLLSGCVNSKLTPTAPVRPATTRTPDVLRELPQSGTYDVVGTIEVFAGLSESAMIEEAQKQAAAIGSDAIVITQGRKSTDLSLPWQANMYAVAIRRR